MAHYFEIVCTKDGRTECLGRVDYEPSDQPFDNRAVLDAKEKAIAFAEKMRGQGFRCRVRHHITITIQAER